MTRVFYDREGLCLRMKGHAGAGEAGGDLVCAALSMLMMAIERRAVEMSGRFRPVICRGAGCFMIQCAPEERDEGLCRESFDTIAAGVAALSENRPEYVSLTLENGETDEEEEG